MARLPSLRRFADWLLFVQTVQAVGRRLRGRVRQVLVPPLSKMFAARYVTNKALFESPDKYGLIEFGRDETIVIPAPRGSSELPEPFVKRVGNWEINRPWYAEIANARLLGPTAVAYTLDNEVVGESVIPENYADRYAGVTIRSLCLSSLSSSHLPKVEAACSMVGAWSQSYFEWLVEFLPRLPMVNVYRERTGRVLKLVVDAKPTRWQRESLSLLGYANDDLIPWNGYAARVDPLLVPSFPRRLCVPGRTISLVSPEALCWTRDSILSRLSRVRDEGPERIWISRSKASGRRVVNEAEVMELLSRFGFVSRILEDLSFTEQVRLFAKARFVVAPHGAGLANMIFSDELSVVELFGSYVNPSFFTLASSLGFRYACLECESIRTIHPKRDHLKVRLNDLERLIEECEPDGRPQGAVTRSSRVLEVERP